MVYVLSYWQDLYRGHKLSTDQTGVLCGSISYKLGTILTFHYWQNWPKMWLVKELLALLVLIIKESVQQSIIPLSTKYQRVSVEANSFQDIRTTNLISQGWVRPYNIQLLLFTLRTLVINCPSSDIMPFSVPQCVQAIPIVKPTILRHHNAMRPMLLT